MDREYLSITQDDKVSSIAMAVVSREREIFHYGVNILNYKSMLSVLPDGDVPNGADDLTKEQYAWRDRLRELLKTEQSEQWKSKLIYDALVRSLPSDSAQRADLISAAKSKVYPEDTLK